MAGLNEHLVRFAFTLENQTWAGYDVVQGLKKCYEYRGFSVLTPEQSNFPYSHSHKEVHLCPRFLLENWPNWSVGK